MKLTDAELKQFDEEGYLFFPGKFTPAEAALMKQEADKIYQMDRKEVWREKTGVARTAFAAHKYNETFKRLGAHRRQHRKPPRLLWVFCAISNRGEIRGMRLRGPR